MQGIDRIRRGVVDLAARLGLEDEVKRLRALTDRGLRRDLRDHEALRLVLALSLALDAHTIDVGAHRGDVLRECRRLAPNGRHVAFEPIPGLHADLVREFPDAEVRDTALSDESGETSFVHVVNAPGLSGLRERDYPGTPELRRINVRTERLDDVLPDGFRPAFIKIDVEGAELQVMKGGRETLLRFRPVVVFEHGKGGAEHYGTRSVDVHDLLVGDVGLRIFDLAGEGPYSRARFQQVFDEPVWNFVATP